MLKSIRQYQTKSSAVILFISLMLSLSSPKAWLNLCRRCMTFLYHLNINLKHWISNKDSTKSLQNVNFSLIISLSTSVVNKGLVMIVMLAVTVMNIYESSLSNLLLTCWNMKWDRSQKKPFKSNLHWLFSQAPNKNSSSFDFEALISILFLNLRIFGAPGWSYIQSGA